MNEYIYPFSAFPGTVDFGRLTRNIQINATIIADAAVFMEASPTVDTSELAACVVFDVALGAAAETALEGIVAALASGSFNADNWTVAELAAAADGYTGQTAFATDGRTAAEGPGAGTGVCVYFNASEWRTFYDDTKVLA